MLLLLLQKPMLSTRKHVQAWHRVSKTEKPAVYIGRTTYSVYFVAVAVVSLQAHLRKGNNGADFILL